jgi:hypothetical protein
MHTSRNNNQGIKMPVKEITFINEISSEEIAMKANITIWALTSASIISLKTNLCAKICISKTYAIIGRSMRKVII